MKLFKSLLVILLFGIICGFFAEDGLNKRKVPLQNDKRPNVIIVMTDDQGYGELSCHGNPVLRTPNLDELHDKSLRFTDYHVAPMCTPTRSQLLTRLDAARNGAVNVSSESTLLRLELTTIADLFNNNGYQTGIFGKWHLGDAPDFLPTRQGFDTYFGIPFSNDMWLYHPRMPPGENEDSMMLAILTRAEYTGFAGQVTYYPPDGGFTNDLPLMIGDSVIEKNPDQTQLTTRYTEAALKFIDEQHENSFFFYLAHAMPHVPLFVSNRYAGKSYRGLYGDVIMEIDWSVGQILEKLKKHGIDKQTLVVFTSDNGPWLSYGIDGGSAGPLRDGKGSAYEGGFRVPAIFWWPGTIPSNQRIDAFAGNLDLFPTIGKLAGARLLQDRILDGADLWPLLTGESDSSPHEYFHYMGGSREGRVNYLGIRDGRWKLLVTVLQKGTIIGRELYDLGADISERFNRLQAHLEIAECLVNEAQHFYDELRKNLRLAGKRGHY